MFNEYVNAEGRVIYATSVAYNAIYRAQGFKPKFPAEDIFNTALGGSYPVGSTYNLDGLGAKPAARRKSGKA